MKKTNLATIPLKTLNWTKLPAQKIKDTVFAELDDAEVHDTMKDTYNDFEHLFAAKEIKKDATKGSNDSLPATSKDITFLDPKRSQNANIMLKAIKLTPYAVTRAVNDCDIETLPLHVLGELLKVVPTDDEIVSIKLYENEADNLAPAEKFMAETSKIKDYELKVKAMYFKASFGELLLDAETSVRYLREGTADARDSKKFKELLKVILALGNYMNPGQRGGAYGFKIGSILKLGDTKSVLQNRKHTLLHYLTEIVPKKFPQADGFLEELTHVEDACKGKLQMFYHGPDTLAVMIPDTRKVLITIRDNLKTIKALLARMEADEAAAGSAFFREMAGFYEVAQEQYEASDARFKEAEREYLRVLATYAEDAKTTPPEFFGTFFQFCQAYAGAVRENEMAVAKVREQEKKEAQKKSMEERRKKKKDLASRGGGGGGTDASKAGAGAAGGGGSGAAGAAGGGGSSGADAGLDDLISAIRTGKAFGGAGDGQPRKRVGRGGEGRTAATAVAGAGAGAVAAGTGGGGGDGAGGGMRMLSRLGMGMGGQQPGLDVPMMDTAETVHISSLALLKMLKHGRAGVPMEVMGLMLGEFIDDYTVRVVDVFAMPQSGTGVSVEAVDEVFQTKMLDMLKQTGRPEMVVGWYHSHPGFGCWLSSVDVQTQNSFEQLHPRSVAVVVDPVQSVRGKVVIDAFRLIAPQQVKEPRQTTSNIGYLNKPSIQALIHGLNRHYYSIGINYRKNELEEKMLLNLHKQGWTKGLTLKNFDDHFKANEDSVKKLLTLSDAYNKSVQEEATLTGEQLKTRHVGKQDPKRHLEENVERLMGDNIVQCLGSMLDVDAF
ncbi:multicatalytic endopeptidase [Cladochytrium tenue]|nr:multicatalytic endopeptidase [Cladochytrium tenue]